MVSTQDELGGLHMRLMTMKSMVMLIMVLLIFNLFGCKKDDNQEKIDEDLPVNEEVEDTTDMDINESLDEAIQETADAVDDSLETVIEDVYDQDDGLSIVEQIDVNLVETTIDLTEKQLLDIKTMVYYAYFNYLWKPDSEDGIIEKEQMQKFAISYIYQYEYNELFFDTNSFELHIPDQKVTEIVRVFFDESFVNHTIESDLVGREVGFYKMTAVDGGVIYDPVIVEIIKTSDFSYQVIYESLEPTAGIDEPKIQYSIDIEERGGRYIYTAYKMLVIRD